MAVVTPLPGIPEPMSSPIRYPEIDLRRLSLSSEIVEEITQTPPRSPALRAVDDVIHVAVGKQVKESEANLIWALHNSGGRKIIILHVHQPAQKIPMMGANVDISRLDDYQVRAYHEKERQDMQKIMDKYIVLCRESGVEAELLSIEMESIEKGIVELVSQHNIRKLVMGAAANKQYSRKMKEPKSKKASYVRMQAPYFCHIWFICKGHLILTRKSRSGGVNREVTSPPLQASPSSEMGQANSLRSKSVIHGHDQLPTTNLRPDFRRVHSENRITKISGTRFPDGNADVTFQSRLSTEGSAAESSSISMRSPSVCSHISTSSSNEMVDDSASISAARTEGSEDGLDLRVLSPPGNDHSYSLYSAGGQSKNELYDRLEQYMAESERSKTEAFEESLRRKKAEKNVIDAMRKVEASEAKYTDELRQRREVEEALARGKGELEKMKWQITKITEDLRVAREQKSSLERQIVNSDKIVAELEQKMFSAVELLQKYKNERDELQEERDNALREAEDLRRMHFEAASSMSSPRYYAEFSFSEIEQATRNFDPSLKIGEGGYGSIYKGLLRHTDVAIKMLHPQSLQGPSEFQQEVRILSKLRHPNLVTLIGACPEIWTLVYEYLPNGSLEDRLCCKDNTPPLSWQTRIRIASEICSVLIFLHSCKPRGIVHGDLKPANILLDVNYVSKLSDFGICRVLRDNEFSNNNTSLCCRTDPKGTFAYVDPEFMATGELTPKSDIYSFGIILLRLLTGRSALGITKEVQYALDNGNLKNLLDPTAGDWPYVQAKQLAHLAVSCCEMSRRHRPDLDTEVWKVLEPMRVSCGASSFILGSEEHSQVPAYFICPIFQEIMQDPVVAADGFTYEGEALKGWLDSGHDTSPMTNLKLAHSNLVPNHALRSAIQEWLQHK